MTASRITHHTSCNKNLPGNQGKLYDTLEPCCSLAQLSLLPLLKERTNTLLNPHPDPDPNLSRRPQHHQHCQHHNVHVLSVKDLEDFGMDKVIEMALEAAWDGCDAVYMSCKFSRAVSQGTAWHGMVRLFPST